MPLSRPRSRHCAVQRACTARQAVHLAGQFVEQVGYSASGRTLVIDVAH